MKVVIDIPEEFEQHFNLDRFKDSLSRIRCDTRYCFGDGVSGEYEIELLDMLVEAFQNSKEERENLLVVKDVDWTNFLEWDDQCNDGFLHYDI